MVFIRMLWWIWLGKKNTEFAILNLREFTVLAFAPFQFTLIYEHFSLPKIQCILNKLCTERWTLHFIWNIFPYFWWIILFHFISTLPLHLNRFVAKTSKLLPKKKKVPEESVLSALRCLISHSWSVLLFEFNSIHT